MQLLLILLTTLSYQSYIYSSNVLRDASETSTTESSTTTTHTESSSTSTDHSGSSSTHIEVTSPIIPNSHDGGFNATTVYPDDFTCLKVVNPQLEEECLNLNMTDKGYSCCFVHTLVRGKSINNSCVAMNSTILPAIQFLVKNMTVEAESVYNCYSLIERFTYDILLMVLGLILIN